MATSTTETPTPPDIPVESDGMHLEETIGHWADLRMAHEALMVDKVQRVNQYALDAAEFARTGVWPARAGEDDMSVSIGNKEYHYHYAAQTTAVDNSAPAAPGAPVASAGSSVAAGLSSWLKPAAIVGASVLGGGGAAAVVNTVWPDSPPAQVAPADTDTDTNSNLELGEL